jgi:hypothetical protein
MQQILQGPYTKSPTRWLIFKILRGGWSKAVLTRIIFLDEGSTCAHGHKKTDRTKAKEIQCDFIRAQRKSSASTSSN